MRGINPPTITVKVQRTEVLALTGPNPVKDLDLSGPARARLSQQFGDFEGEEVSADGSKTWVFVRRQISPLGGMIERTYVDVANFWWLVEANHGK